MPVTALTVLTWHGRPLFICHKGCDSQHGEGWLCGWLPASTAECSREHAHDLSLTLWLPGALPHQASAGLCELPAPNQAHGPGPHWVRRRGRAAAPVCALPGGGAGPGCRHHQGELFLVLYVQTIEQLSRHLAHLRAPSTIAPSRVGDDMMNMTRDLGSLGMQGLMVLAAGHKPAAQPAVRHRPAPCGPE